MRMDLKDPGWAEALRDELNSDYMRRLAAFLNAERSAGKAIYPPAERIFAAFDETPLDRVKVVICGQDPYHGAGQATGLAFAVPAGVPLPPSLRNIFRELADDLGLGPYANGDLTPWAHRGVLLLNATLTVEAERAGSHAGRGWERFTDRVIDVACAAHDDLVFLLWGRHAQAKGQRVDVRRHHVLVAAHPSPLSARRGFFGCRHFSRANELLVRCGKQPIDWALD